MEGRSNRRNKARFQISPVKCGRDLDQLLFNCTCYRQAVKMQQFLQINSLALFEMIFKKKTTSKNNPIILNTCETGYKNSVQGAIQIPCSKAG